LTFSSDVALGAADVRKRERAIAGFVKGSTGEREALAGPSRR
jgi:hypothetical protein